MSVFQLLLMYLESTLHCANLLTAEGTVLQLIFIPTFSFLFPPFFHVVTICCSNKMARPVIPFFLMLLGAYRGKVGIGNGSEHQQVCWLPFLYLHGAVESWVGVSSCCAYRHPAQAVQAHSAAEVGQHTEIFADCKPATSFPQQAGWGPAVGQK